MLVRCMSKFVFCCRKKWWQSLLLVVTVLFSFTVNAQDSSTSTRAAHLIRHYLLAHPELIESIKRTRDEGLEEIKYLQQLVPSAISVTVDNTQPTQAFLPSIYPVRSTTLSPGKVISRAIQVTLPTPIFIVGDDTQSKSWLKQYKRRLLQLHATGFIVNAESCSAILTLQLAFPKLSFYPLPGDALAEWLKLKHYPALISDHLIEQ